MSARTSDWKIGVGYRREACVVITKACCRREEEPRTILDIVVWCAVCVFPISPRVLSPPTLRLFDLAL